MQNKLVSLKNQDEAFVLLAKLVGEDDVNNRIPLAKEISEKISALAILAGRYELLIIDGNKHFEELKKTES